MPEHIEPILARNRFDGALLVSTGSEAEEIAQLLAWCEQSAMLKGVVLAWGEGPAAVEPAALNGVLRGYWVDSNAAVDDAAATCSARGVALDIVHGGTGFEAGTIAAAASANPGTPIVLAHAGGPPLEQHALAEWMEAMRALAKEPNVHVKLSGFWSTALDTWNLATVQSLIVFLIDTFGAGRLLFGSDWPFCLPAHSWKECLARFTQSIGARKMDFRELLLGENAVRVYRLPRPDAELLSPETHFLKPNC